MDNLSFAGLWGEGLWENGPFRGEWGGIWGSEGLPKENLLQFIPSPGNYGVGDEAKYILSISCYAAVGTGSWFSDATTPIARTMTEILADTTVNEYHITAGIGKGVAVYDPSASPYVIHRVHLYFHSPTYYSSGIITVNGETLTTNDEPITYTGWIVP